MATSGRAADIVLDTSAAVALVVEDHEFHEATIQALGARHLGLSGHAAFETFSVLTRLPPPARRTPAVVAQLMAANFPSSVFLSEAASSTIMDRLVEADIAGGSVYDALVGLAAAEHGLTLATRDRRAIDTYRLLGVDLEILPDSL